MNGNGNAGFTLLETLVALAVLTIALTALWKAQEQGIIVTDTLPDRALARWVAHNRLALRQASGQGLEPRVYRGSEQQGGRTWFWEERVTTTSESQLLSIHVTVGPAPADLSLFSLRGFVRNKDG